MDPEMARQKLEGLSRQQLAELFLSSWHPIVELEQLTPSMVKEATEYWRRMLSFFERRKRLQLGPLVVPGTTGLGQLSEEGLVEEKGFTRKLEDVWEQLKLKSTPEETVGYWAFVSGSSFTETVVRAQMVSFLVSYGFATLEEREKNLVLRARSKPQPAKNGSPLSFPIPIPKEVPLSRAK